MKLSLNNFWTLVAEEMTDNPDWRLGQAVFNVLAEFRPDISEALRATESDPFYTNDTKDPRYTRALKYMDDHWEDPV